MIRRILLALVLLCAPLGAQAQPISQLPVAPLPLPSTDYVAVVQPGACQATGGTCRVTLGNLLSAIPNLYQAGAGLTLTGNVFSLNNPLANWTFSGTLTLPNGQTVTGASSAFATLGGNNAWTGTNNFSNTLTLPDGETWGSNGISGPLVVNTTNIYGALISVGGSLSISRGAGFMSEGAYMHAGGGTVTNTTSSGFYNDNFALNSWNSAQLDATSATTYDKISTMYCGNPPTVTANVSFNTSYCFYSAGGKVGIFSSASNNGQGGLIISSPQTLPYWGVVGPLLAVTAVPLVDSTAYTASGNNPVSQAGAGVSFQAPTIDGNGCSGSCTGVTYQQFSTITISGAPIAGSGPVGTTIAITNPYSLNVAAGLTRLNGGLQTTTIRGTAIPTTGTAVGSACFDSSGNIINKTTTGPCI
jgi:hypothetical protein